MNQSNFDLDESQTILFTLQSFKPFALDAARVQKAEKNLGISGRIRPF